MRPAGRSLGIAAGLVPWGAHLLSVYGSRDSLDQAVVRYLEAGVVAGEACLWIAPDNASARLRQASHDLGSPLARYLETDVLTVADFREWYFSNGALAPDDAHARWAGYAQEARRGGFAGVRVAADFGDPLTEAEWDAVTHYEEALGPALKLLPQLSLCAYPREQLDAPRLERIRQAHDWAPEIPEAPMRIFSLP